MLNHTNPNKFVFKFSSSPPSPAGEGIYENLLGLVSVPAVVIYGQVFHLDVGAPIDDLKNNECGEKGVQNSKKKKIELPLTNSVKMNCPY